MKQMLHRYALYFAWLIATIGTLGSLYYSDVLNYEPCHLCWYQRIALFPLVIILGIATYRDFQAIAPYLLPQILAGFFLAVYQVAIQEIPDWNPIEMCGSGPSCSEKISIGLGPITIPMLSALGFFVICALLLASWSATRAEKKRSVDTCSSISR